MGLRKDRAGRGKALRMEEEETEKKEGAGVLGGVWQLLKNKIISQGNTEV